MQIGDLVRTSLWGNGIVLEMVHQRDTADGASIVMVERIVQNKHIRRISRENLEVISESR